MRLTTKTLSTTGIQSAFDSLELFALIFKGTVLLDGDRGHLHEPFPGHHAVLLATRDSDFLYIFSREPAGLHALIFDGNRLVCQADRLMLGGWSLREPADMLLLHYTLTPSRDALGAWR